MHKAEYDQYIGKTREDKLKNLTVAMKKREIMFKKPFEETENIVKASYVISELKFKN